MTSQKLFDGVSRTALELVQQVREGAEQQKALWQKVPYLALQADGRTGYSDNYCRAYHQGYWAVEGSQVSGSYTIYVDLETGVLVNAYDPRQKARDNDILRIAFGLHELDAADIIAGIQAHARMPCGTYYNNKELRERKARIASILREGHITRTAYHRTVSPEAVHRQNVIAPFQDMFG